MSVPGKRGRNCKWSPLYVDFARERYLRGDTHGEVAKLLGVSVTTVKKWVREQPEYRDAFYEGRLGAPEFRLSQMPEHEPLFPPAPRPQPEAQDAGHPIIKVERIFVEPPIRDR